MIEDLRGEDELVGAGLFDQAFESCMNNEDKSFPAITSRRYQSQPAAEEALRGAATR